MPRCCSSKESCKVDGCSNPNHHQLLHKSNTARVNQESVTTVLHSRCSQSSKEKKRLPLLPILPIRESYGDKSETTYALLDTGSQQSFCTSKLAEMLEAVGRKATMKLKTMNQSDKLKAVEGDLVDLRACSLDNGPEINLHQVFSVEKLPIETCTVFSSSDLAFLNHLKDIDLPELVDKSLEVLIGMDCKSALKPLECRSEAINEPDAIRTPLGWVVYGCDKSPLSDSHEKEVADTFNMVLEEFTDGPSLIDPSISVVDCGLSVKNSREDRVAFEKMKASIQLVDNHLQLSLLWREETPKLPDNRKAAEVRSMHLKRRLAKDADLRQRYVEVMESYVRDGYAEKIPAHESSSSNLSWFLPHFPVVNLKKPEKLRIVFDCGA